MAIKFYLAMMAEKIEEFTVLPENPAFIYHTFPGISPEIPRGGIPVLTDRYPVKAEFAESTARWIRQWNCEAVLLDFQKPETEEAGRFARLLQTCVSCPVVVSERYAARTDCPVFLSPLPHHIALKDHLAPWQGREIWIDLTPLPEQLRLTEQGCSAHTDFLFSPCGPVHRDPALHCHYSITPDQDRVSFTFWRTEDDFSELLQELEDAGIQYSVGLQQEWAKKNRPSFPERF